MNAIVSAVRARAQVLLLGLAGLGLSGCNCGLLEFEDADDGCAIGVQCPDGTCVLSLFGGSEDTCCGFGGECLPCSGAFQGPYDVECPDGTCAISAEACCEHGGACDPGDDDESGLSSGSDGSGSGSTGETEGTASESSASGSTAADDPSGESSGTSTDSGETWATDTGWSTEGTGGTGATGSSSST